MLIISTFPVKYVYASGPGVLNYILINLCYLISVAYVKVSFLSI